MDLHGLQNIRRKVIMTGCVFLCIATSIAFIFTDELTNFYLNRDPKDPVTDDNSRVSFIWTNNFEHLP